MACLGPFWQHYRRDLLGPDPSSASLSALVWSGDSVAFAVVSNGYSTDEQRGHNSYHSDPFIRETGLKLIIKQQFLD